MKTLQNQTAFQSAPDKQNFTTRKFLGTENPRHLRALNALLTRPQRREHLDQIVGCSNGPELIAQLRRCGLSIPCLLVADLDRDGRPIRRGVYYLTTRDRQALRRWLSSRGK